MAGKEVRHKDQITEMGELLKLKYYSKDTRGHYRVLRVERADHPKSTCALTLKGPTKF